jgi:hypothetical protein
MRGGMAGMNNKEINEIIENYSPHKGFLDLSKKPEKLNKKTYAKILRTQNFSPEQNKHEEYFTSIWRS